MAGTTEQKQEAVAEREARQNAALAAAQRRQRLWLLGATTVTAIAIVIAAIAIGTAGGGSGTTTGTPKHRGSTLGLLRGVPQHGVTLGKPNAPVTITEFADLQCPYCGEYTRGVFPTLVTRYVRTGRVKIVFRNTTALGPDSEKA